MFEAKRYNWKVSTALIKEHSIRINDVAKLTSWAMVNDVIDKEMEDGTDPEVLADRMYEVYQMLLRERTH